MTRKEHRKWIRYWVNLAEERLASPWPMKLSAAYCKFGAIAQALERAGLMIDELKKLEGRKPRWTAGPQ